MTPPPQRIPCLLNSPAAVHHSMPSIGLVAADHDDRVVVLPPVDSPYGAEVREGDIRRHLDERTDRTLGFPVMACGPTTSSRLCCFARWAINLSSFLASRLHFGFVLHPDTIEVVEHRVE